MWFGGPRYLCTSKLLLGRQRVSKLPFGLALYLGPHPLRSAGFPAGVGDIFIVSGVLEGSFILGIFIILHRLTPRGFSTCISQCTYEMFLSSWWNPFFHVCQIA